jgi:hypothetical protein
VTTRENEIGTVLEDTRKTDKEQYWETLRQRWGALMSYRYIGRQFSSMNNVDDDTVTLRHDMRNAAGGILAQVFSISAPGGGGPSDLEVVPNPSSIRSRSSTTATT